MPPLWPAITIGSRDNPVVVFLHGFLGDAQDWLDVANCLAEKYYCILPDLPGHGQNSFLPPPPLMLSSLAADLFHTLKAQEIHTYFMVGYSMGGRLALQFTLLYPQQVIRLVLESSSPGIEESSARIQRQELDQQRAAQIIQTGLPAFLKTWYAAPLFSSLTERPELLASILDRRQRMSPKSAARIIDELSPGRQPSLWLQLKKVLMPVLVLAGELDRKYAAEARLVAGNIPDARLALAPGAGHVVHLETPEWIAGQLKAFLNAESN